MCHWVLGESKAYFHFLGVWGICLTKMLSAFSSLRVSNPGGQALDQLENLQSDDVVIRQRCGTAEVWAAIGSGEKLVAGFFLKLERGW